MQQAKIKCRAFKNSSCAVSNNSPLIPINYMTNLFCCLMTIVVFRVRRDLKPNSLLAKQQLVLKRDSHIYLSLQLLELQNCGRLKLKIRKKFSLSLILLWISYVFTNSFLLLSFSSTVLKPFELQGYVVSHLNISIKDQLNFAL